MPSQRLISIAEASRQIGAPVKKLTQVLLEYGVKIRFKGRIRLVDLDDVRRVWSAISENSLEKTSGHNEYRDRLLAHLESTVARLEEENRELRQDCRLANKHVERLMLDLSNLKLPAPVEVSSEEPVMKRAGATYDSEEVDLDSLCRIIDRNRGVKTADVENTKGGVFSRLRSKSGNL